MYDPFINNFIKNCSKLPGIGTKASERIALFLMQNRQELQELNKTIELMDKHIIKCECGFFSTSNPCYICNDDKRDKSKICIVKNMADVISIEKTKQFNGTYHILGGLISSIDGCFPQDLNLDNFRDKIIKNKINEIIIALSATTEAKTTQFYILSKIKNLKVNIFEPAHGIPLGADLELLDQATLSAAIISKKEIENNDDF
ncbi:MAG: recombination protein RecR [Alphaproteobacteria bacterium]|nr:recombination protein RecR [Alphaproteobacteria bacterium]